MLQKAVEVEEAMIVALCYRLRCVKQVCIGQKVTLYSRLSDFSGFTDTAAEDKLEMLGVKTKGDSQQWGLVESKQGSKPL